MKHLRCLLGFHPTAKLDYRPVYHFFGVSLADRAGVHAEMAHCGACGTLLVDPMMIRFVVEHPSPEQEALWNQEVLRSRERRMA
jgi:hypothetical protein